jgi:hypothetical protein
LLNANPELFDFRLQDEREKKRLEQLERKKEADALLEKELNSIKVNTATKPPPKITRASIQVRCWFTKSNSYQQLYIFMSDYSFLTSENAWKPNPVFFIYYYYFIMLRG